MIKRCTVCKSMFQVERRHYDKRKTCGNKQCNSIHRSRKMSGSGNHQYGLTGELNSSYTGGRIVDSHGYVRVLRHDHPNCDAQGYVKEHILVMSEILGRPLDTSIEVVHHIDGNKTNNDPSNLQLMTKSSHTSLHNKDNIILRDEYGRFDKILKAGDL